MDITSIEQCWSCMSKPFLREKIVGFNGIVDVGAMNTNSHTHEHVLRSFSDGAVHAA